MAGACGGRGKAKALVSSKHCGRASIEQRGEHVAVNVTGESEWRPSSTQEASVGRELVADRLEQQGAE